MSTGPILVVDDEADIRSLIQDILVDEGYRVAVADNAEAARARVRQEQPSLVLLDIWMPGEDGLTCSKSWAAPGLDFPVVIMPGTAPSRPRSRQRAWAPGISSKSRLPWPSSC